MRIQEEDPDIEDAIDRDSSQFQENIHTRQRIDYEQQIGVYVFAPHDIREPTSLGVIHHHPNESYHVIPSRPYSLKEDKSIASIMLFAQRALLGEISSDLRAVLVNRNKDGSIKIAFYHDGPMTWEKQNEYSCIASELAADFINAEIVEEFISLKYPEPLPQDGHYVYLRKEGRTEDQSNPQNRKKTNPIIRLIARLLLRIIGE